MVKRETRFKELLEIKERRTPELLRRSGVEGVGVGRDEIVVFARRGAPVEREIEGRPVRVIRTGKISILMKLKERIEEAEPVLAVEGLTKSEISAGCFEWASPLYIPKKYHAPFLSPVSGAQIGQQWGIIDDENTHSYAGYVLWKEKPEYMEIYHTRYAQGDYSIKAFDILGPGHYSDWGGHGGAGIRLKITDGIMELGKEKDLGKTLGVSETSTWNIDWNRFIFDPPIPVKKGQHYLLCVRAKEPMPPIKFAQGWEKGYCLSASKQEGFVVRPAFGGKLWRLDCMNLILREWVVSVEGTICTNCTTQAECKSNGCYWWGPGKFMPKGYWWRYPCHSYPKHCRFYGNIDECAAAGCTWANNGCYQKGGIPITPPSKTGRHKKWRPAPPGVEIGNVKAPGWGTFTAVVLKNGVKKILGCRHVLAYGDCSLNSIIAQPLYSADKIGVLEYYPPLKSGTNEVDCAIAKLDNQADVVPGVLLNDDAYSPSIIPTGVEDAYAGQSVMKSGARTGVVSSNVASINTDVRVDTELGERTYNGCIVTGVIGAGGDSGSILLSKASNKAVGMLFAGSDTTTVHIPMKKTLSALGCTLMTQEGPPPQKTYMKYTTTPSGAGIWLKKH